MTRRRIDPARARRAVLGTTAAVALTAALYGCAASSPGIAATSASSAATTTTSSASPSAAPKSVVRHHGSRAPSRRLIASAALGRRTKSAGCRVRGALPDPACTPGGVFPHATAAEICTPGYAERVRAVLVSTKDAVYASYGISFHAAGRYQIDHLVPLEVGGNNTRANLWPQVTPGYGEKDTVENELHAAVCSGRIALAPAQAQIAHDWRHAGVPVPTPSGPAIELAVARPVAGARHARGVLQHAPLRRELLGGARQHRAMRRRAVQPLGRSPRSVQPPWRREIARATSGWSTMGEPVSRAAPVPAGRHAAGLAVADLTFDI
jgi:hypothetical protein